MQSYSLPAIVDPNSCQTIAITAVDSTLSQPSYLTAVTLYSLQISSTSSSDIGIHPITVSLNDGITTTTSTMTIEFTNTAPQYSTPLDA
jgi:hypothetical protein